MSTRLKATRSDSGVRLDRFLQEKAGVSLRGARRLIEDGMVRVNGRTRPALYRLHVDDDIEMTQTAGKHPVPESVRAAPLAVDGAQIIGYTGEYAFFHKPAGLHSVALSGASSASLEGMVPDLWHAPAPVPSPCGAEGNSAAETLSAFCRAALPYLPTPPHTLPSPEAPCPRSVLPALLTRLDEPTSGIVAAALSSEAAQRFRAMEAEGLIAKYYLALVQGDFPEERELRGALDSAKRRVTRVLAQDTADATRTTRVIPLPLPAALLPSGLSLVLARIRRGARHQIRAHLAHAGFPLAGDTLYSGEEMGNSPFFLHHICMVLPGVSVFDPPVCFPALPLRPEHEQ
ncbi:hypothetical protein LJC23_03965 [Desulfovibrio sp. OttesenSCG-928-I05]|nr:hypothetical protein [Desulfovibrio sp. OttesenSCG-928-I05]